MPRPPNVIERLLIAISRDPLQSVVDVANELGSKPENIHTARWTLRKQGLLTDTNTLTDAGRTRVEQLTAANDAGQPAATTKPRKKAKKRAPPQAKAAPAGVPALPIPAPASRIEAVHRVADSVIANARNAQRVLRAYLEEELVEVTPLLESLLDNCAGSITLIEQTYHAAR